MARSYRVFFARPQTRVGLLAPPASGITTTTTSSLTASSSAASSGQRVAGRLAVDVDADFRYHEDRSPTHGYEARREAAMAFAKS
jgi:hypothetical protein